MKRNTFWVLEAEVGLQFRIEGVAVKNKFSGSEKVKKPGVGSPEG